MNIITSTELRTKTPKVIKTLLNGGVIDIIHRSRIVGEIRPKKVGVKVFDAKKFLKITSKLNLPRLSDQELKQNYFQHLKKKYGKGLPRH